MPSDRTLCPLCSQKRANPSVITVSGFVFCYACVFKYVTQVRFPVAVNLENLVYDTYLGPPALVNVFRASSLIISLVLSVTKWVVLFFIQYKRCPVTLMPANVDQIRRLFHDV